jgi:signal transduction protein with GAF and PtsI domain
MSERRVKIDQSRASIGIGYSETTTAEKIGGVFRDHDSEINQELQEAVLEIQQLIEELQKTNPSNTTSEKAIVATRTIEQIENDSNWKKRLIDAVKKGSLAAFEKTLAKVTDSIIVGFITEAVKSWIKKS